MKMSREAITKLSVVAACAAAAVVSSCLFAFSSPVLPAISGAIVFPLEGENVVLIAAQHGNMSSVTSWYGTDDDAKEAEIDRRLEEAGYRTTLLEGNQDDLIPWENYENVVTVNSPTADQVIVREVFPVEDDGETVLYEAVLWGDGTTRCGPVEDGQEQE